jgi:hypothetical protein
MIALATVFIHPMVLNKWQEALMLLPLCLAISVVYKTTKSVSLREIPAASLVSWVTIVIGMYAVGAALLLLFSWAT